MLLALMLLANPQSWVPIRWPAADEKTLQLLQGSPINCLLLEKANWRSSFLAAAAKHNIVALGVVHPSAGAFSEAQAVVTAGLNGVVLEGEFERPARERITKYLADVKVPVVELCPRSEMAPNANPLVLGTYQGVWPGIQIDDGGATKAAPSGAPWINTNSGFLRFLRALSKAPIWISHKPPSGVAITGERYLQAIGDAAMVGARWVITLDKDFSDRLFASDERVLAEWKRIVEEIAFFETNWPSQGMRPLGQLAIVQDANSGALLSGGVLDMIAVKHTPVRTVPTRLLDAPLMDGTTMAVNVDPSSLTEPQKQALRGFARGGGTVLSGPASWKFPEPAPGKITLSDEDVKMLDEIWKEVNTMTGRRNLGVRLFNVSSMLSNMVEDPSGGRALLHLVNYSGYPVENVTVHLLGKYRKATLRAPGSTPKVLSVYDVDEGAATGVDIENVGIAATLLVEK
jgi:hypothetical protein